jgi:hypothetical protein
VGHGADALAIADATGAFVNDDPLFLQSTGFVLDPGGRVVVSVYSSGAIGRLVPQDVIGLIRYLREQRLASRQHPAWARLPSWSRYRSISKSYGLPGPRIGWIATRDAALREAVSG